MPRNGARLPRVAKCPPVPRVPRPGRHAQRRGPQCPLGRSRPARPGVAHRAADRMKTNTPHVVPLSAAGGFFSTLPITEPGFEPSSWFWNSSAVARGFFVVVVSPDLIAAEFRRRFRSSSKMILHGATKLIPQPLTGRVTTGGDYLTLLTARCADRQGPCFRSTLRITIGPQIVAKLEGTASISTSYGSTITERSSEHTAVSYWVIVGYVIKTGFYR